MSPLKFCAHRAEAPDAVRVDGQGRPVVPGSWYVAEETAEGRRIISGVRGSCDEADREACRMENDAGGDRIRGSAVRPLLQAAADEFDTLVWRLIDYNGELLADFRGETLGTPAALAAGRPHPDEVYLASRCEACGRRVDPERRREGDDACPACGWGG